MERAGIRIDGLKGSWYVIDETEWNGETVYLLENEQSGDDVACIIVNEKLKLIAVDVWNGLSELNDIEEENDVVGMNFKKWCDLDPDDTRKINYEKVAGYKKFTSEDSMDSKWLWILQNSTIEKLELRNNEWYVWLK